MFDSLNQSEKEGAAGGQTRTRCKWCLEFNTPYIIGGTCAAMIQTHRQTSGLQVGCANTSITVNAGDTFRQRFSTCVSHDANKYMHANYL